jgi:hypothetical protein
MVGGGFYGTLSHMRPFHRIVGLTSAVFLIVIALSGILLQHWSFFSSVKQAEASPFSARIQDAVVDRDGAIWLGSSDRVYRSVDGGVSFTPVGLPQSVGVVQSLAVYDEIIVVAGKQGVVLISYDNGRLWERLPLPESLFDLSVLRYDGRYFHVVGNSGYWQAPWPNQTGFPTWVCLDAHSAYGDAYHTILAIHSGYWGGDIMLWVYTVAGLALVGLTVTGLYLYPWRRFFRDRRL